MEKQGKMREEIAEYQLRLQEAEKKHQALLLDINKQVKMCGLVTGGTGESVLTTVMRHFFPRRSVFCIIIMTYNPVNIPSY